MILGVVLFAFAIFVAVCLHEAGHLLTAKAFGMKATQYFAGFGPTLWSFRRGETEYGVKAIPAGGFVKILGMTPLEEVPAEDEKRAFWRFPAPQRLVVLASGSFTHFLLAFVTLWGVALVVGVPADRPQLAGVSTCVPRTVTQEQPNPTCTPADPSSPARAAGLRNGDEVVAFDGHPVASDTALVKAIRGAPPGPATITVRRGDATLTKTLDLVTVRRPDLQNPSKLDSVSAMGVVIGTVRDYPGPAGAVVQGGKLMGTLFAGTFGALGQFPSKVPALLQAVNGGHRDANTPVSVVGASRLGGEAVAADQLTAFFGFFAALNVFIGIFNLLPLLPLDGGHVAILLFEQARSRLARLFGRRDPGRVDVARLLPVTYVVILLFGTLSVLAVIADIVNPIANPFQ